MNRINYLAFRKLVAKTIDDLIFEDERENRNHTYVHKTYVAPLLGICKNTYCNYRNADPKEFEDIELPGFIVVLLQLMSYFHENDRFGIKRPHSGPLTTEEINTYLAKVSERRTELLKTGARAPEVKVPVEEY